MAASFGNITKIPELRNRILFSLAMLAVYRFGIFVTTPGVDRALMSEIIDRQSGTLFGMFNMFVGGALEQASVFSLGIMPYISSSIIFQLLAVVVPKLERLQKEGEQGRKKINQYTRYGTICLAIVQGTIIASNLEGLDLDGRSPACSSRSSPSSRSPRGRRSSCGSASRSPSAASATACR